jgi:hypothetical protein
MIRRLVPLVWALVVACTAHRPAPEPSSPTLIRQAQASPGSALINTYSARAWDAAHVTPAPPASDPEFLRRAFLDLAGRIPTEDEARRFLADKAPERRVHLVDRLLASPDYARHWTDVYLALLVGRDLRAAGGAGRQTMAPYLNKAFSENRGFDQMTRDILTSRGRLDVSGAGAFFLRHAGDGGPEGVAAASASVFLGLQIGCAQCHDHPSDSRYKQADFWGFAGYFAQSGVARGMGDGPGAFIVYEKREGEAKMPQHDTGRSVEVPPKFLGREVRPQADETRREAVARAIIESDLFAKEAVNRTWADLFGRGLVDPYDDLGGEHDPAHPPLLTELSRSFAAQGYDLRWLMRAIVLSDAYGRSSSGGTGDPAALERTFARAAVRPLQPEQLFRSLVTATGFDDVMARKLGEDAAEKKMEQALKQYLFVFGDDEMAEVDAFNGSVPEALLVFNGPMTNQGIRARGGSTLDRILRERRDPSERIESLFLTTYARPPTVDENRHLLAYVHEKLGSRGAYEDVFHAMLTSAEATTNH